MFELYTEKARRVIFYARYEASQLGSPYVETEHLLLGLLREDKALTNRFLGSHASVESIRKQIEGVTVIREKVSTSVDLPISDECKRILAYASEEAEKLGHKHIGTEHLLLGVLREENCFGAKLLKERGVQIASVREQLANPETKTSPQISAAAAPSAPGLFRDLTQAAFEGSLDPVIGRDLELATIIEVLCSSRKNPVLLGPRGAGKTTIVHGLCPTHRRWSSPRHGWLKSGSLKWIHFSLQDGPQTGGHSTSSQSAPRLPLHSPAEHSLHRLLLPEAIRTTHSPRYSRFHRVPQMAASASRPSKVHRHRRPAGIH